MSARILDNVNNNIFIFVEIKTIDDVIDHFDKNYKGQNIIIITILHYIYFKRLWYIFYASVLRIVHLTFIYEYLIMIGKTWHGIRKLRKRKLLQTHYTRTKKTIIYHHLHLYHVYLNTMAITMRCVTCMRCLARARSSENNLLSMEDIKELQIELENNNDINDDHSQLEHKSHSHCYSSLHVGDD